MPYISTILSQLIGPPVGGALFDRFGIHGPCLFGIIVTAVDLIGRLLLIERKEALVWGFDPAASVNPPFDCPPNLRNIMDSQYGTFSAETGFPSEGGRQTSYATDSEETDYANSLLGRDADETMELHPQPDPVSFFQVIKGLFTSSRAVAAFLNSFVYGWVAQIQHHPSHTCLIPWLEFCIVVKSRPCPFIYKPCGSLIPPKLDSSILPPPCLLCCVRPLGS